MTSSERLSDSVRIRPGQVRDTIAAVLAQASKETLTLAEIHAETERILGHNVAGSSIRSSLNLNLGNGIVRTARGEYALSSRISQGIEPVFEYGNAKLFAGDCLAWLNRQPENSIHAVVTDPPYGASEYSDKEQAKLRAGRGGVWRIPPAIGGVKRSPVPRFTTMSPRDLAFVEDFFIDWARAVSRVIVPGGNVIVAANPLVSYAISGALVQGGLERRGEIVRLVQTLRGGDRPKGAHEEYSDVTVMPRSQWEPWLVYRKPLEGTVAENLRKWKTGGFRRVSDAQPFGDVIKGPPARGKEREIAPHPSLKPQSFLRQVVRASLPMGEGIILDPFAGSGSTLAAAEALGYYSVGVERDPEYISLASQALPALSSLTVPVESAALPLD